MEKISKKDVQLDEKIRSGTANIDDYFELGNTYLKRGQYEKLLDLYAELRLKQLSDIELARVYNEEGEAFLAYGEIEKAKILFEKSLQYLYSCGDSAECLLWKGLNHYNLFLYEYDNNLSENHAINALKCFESLIENLPQEQSDHKIHSCIADIYMKFGDYRKALAAYDIALKLSPDDDDKIWILTGIASIYSQKKEYDKSLNYFREALQKAKIAKVPTSKIYYDMGELFFKENRLDEAKNAFQEALKSKDSDPLLKGNSIYDIGIFWHLGIIAYRMQDDVNIINYLEKVLMIIDKRHYYYANSHLTLGHYYWSIGDYEKAREHYNQVLIAPRAADEEIEMAKDCLAKIPLNA
ncbi:MAG: tetratricopeptide repeat protein [Candidatus Diapherotrites archaeon]